MFKTSLHPVILGTIILIVVLLAAEGLFGLHPTLARIVLGFLILIYYPAFKRALIAMWS